MTGAPVVLADLLAECVARGIRLSRAEHSGLEIDAPQDALTPELLARLKAHKGELLAVTRPKVVADEIDRSDVATVWQTALALLDSDPLIPPDLLNALRAADVKWRYEPAPPLPATAVCRCGSTTCRDVPIHDGQSARRDCSRCGRFIDFPIWHGQGRWT